MPGHYGKMMNKNKMNNGKKVKLYLKIKRFF